MTVKPKKLALSKKITMQWGNDCRLLVIATFEIVHLFITQSLFFSIFFFSMSIGLLNLQQGYKKLILCFAQSRNFMHR